MFSGLRSVWIKRSCEGTQAHWEAERKSPECNKGETVGSHVVSRNHRATIQETQTPDNNDARSNENDPTFSHKDLFPVLHVSWHLLEYPLQFEPMRSISSHLEQFWWQRGNAPDQAWIVDRYTLQLCQMSLCPYLVQFHIFQTPMYLVHPWNVLLYHFDLRRCWLRH